MKRFAFGLRHRKRAVALADEMGFDAPPTRLYSFERRPLGLDGWCLRLGPFLLEFSPSQFASLKEEP